MASGRYPVAGGSANKEITENLFYYKATQFILPLPEIKFYIRGASLTTGYWILTTFFTLPITLFVFIDLLPRSECIDIQLSVEVVDFVAEASRGKLRAFIKNPVALTILRSYFNGHGADCYA